MCVGWGSSGSDWNVVAWHRDDGDWDVDYRVFSPATASSGTLASTPAFEPSDLRHYVPRAEFEAFKAKVEAVLKI